MTTTIYHNPRCSKSRAALALLHERGEEIHVVSYLETPPDAACLRRMASMLGVRLVDLARTNENEWREEKLHEDSDEEAIISSIVKHPILLQRPIVVRNGRAVIARPPEKIAELFAE